LPARDVDAVIGEKGIVSVGQSLDKVVDACRMAGIANISLATAQGDSEDASTDAPPPPPEAL
jgi:hypothetical protein